MPDPKPCETYCPVECAKDEMDCYNEVEGNCSKPKYCVKKGSKIVKSKINNFFNQNKSPKWLTFFTILYLHFKISKINLVKILFLGPGRNCQSKAICPENPGCDSVKEISCPRGLDAFGCERPPSCKPKGKWQIFFTRS